MAPTRRHERTLVRIFQEPPPTDLRWADAEALLAHLGAELGEGRGSRVWVVLGSVRAVFHRPHPRPAMDRGAVRSLRRFLMEAGIAPKE